VFTGHDYRGDGVTLTHLGLDGLDRDQIIQFATHGRL